MHLSAADVSVSFDNQRVLEEVSIALSPGDRLGIVGANGAGKTTLLRVLAGEVVPARGTVHRSRHMTIGYLAQSVAFESLDETINDFLRSASNELVVLESRMREFELALGSAGPDELPRLLDEYGAISTEFEQRGGYTLDQRAEEVRYGLGLSHLDPGLRVGALSGGEQARLALAAQLIRSPDVLLLDEPTNHLDDRNREWLEAFLREYRGGVVAVSHDRAFLNAAVNSILFLDDVTHQASRFTGAYDDFRRAVKREYDRQVREAEEYQQEVQELREQISAAGGAVGHGNRDRRDNDKYVNSFKQGRVERAVSRLVQNAEERLQRLLREPVRRPAPPLEAVLRFVDPGPHPEHVLSMRSLSVSFDNRTVLSNVSLDLSWGDKVAIRGENGAGKTTLLRAIIDRVDAPSPDIQWASGTRVGYLGQHPSLPLPGRTLRENLEYGLDPALTASFGLNPASMPFALGLFRTGDLEKRTTEVSLGQLRKLEIVRLVLAVPHVLVLDEPTNHVSLDVVDALEVAIREFKGTVLAVSHDRQFLNTFAGSQLYLESASLRMAEVQGFER